MMTPSRQLFTLTDTARARVRELMASRTEPCLGIRISVKTKGCSGLSYALAFVNESNAYDEVVEDADIKLFIDPKAVMFILGTQMDFVEEKLQSGFTFNNPNEKGKCGCGKSFHV